MSGFCVAKTEGRSHLCPNNADGRCGFYCREYEQGKLPRQYPVPALPYEVKVGWDGKLYAVLDSFYLWKYRSTLPEGRIACFGRYENAIQLS